MYDKFGISTLPEYTLHKAVRVWIATLVILQNLKGNFTEKLSCFIHRIATPEAVAWRGAIKQINIHFKLHNTTNTNMTRIPMAIRV